MRPASRTGTLDSNCASSPLYGLRCWRDGGEGFSGSSECPPSLFLPVSARGVERALARGSLIGVEEREQDRDRGIGPVDASPVEDELAQLGAAQAFRPCEVRELADDRVTGRKRIASAEGCAWTTAVHGPQKSSASG